MGASVLLQGVLAYYYYWVSGGVAFFFWLLCCFLPICLCVLVRGEKITLAIVAIGLSTHIAIALPPILKLATIKTEMIQLAKTAEAHKNQCGSYPKTLEEVGFVFSTEMIGNSLVRYSIDNDELVLIFNQPDSSKGYTYTTSQGWRFIDD